MKFRHIIYIVPLLVACNQEQPSTKPIGLVVGSGIETKEAVTAKEYGDSIPSSENPLYADVWFSTTKDTYKGTGGVPSGGKSIDVHTTITYYGPSITIPDPYESGKYVHYPPLHGNVYCVGLYPQNAWTVSSDGLTATADINGEDDLMFADQQEGNDQSALSKSRQIYNHELTWLKIRVRSDLHETRDTWGKVKVIKVRSASQANVTFSTGEVDYSGSQLITAFESEGVEMPIGCDEFASVMVSPTSSGKYYVDVECENHHKENVEVTLTDYDGKLYTSSTKGKVFVLILYFKTLPTINFSATLTGWEDEGRSLELDD